MLRKALFALLLAGSASAQDYTTEGTRGSVVWYVGEFVDDCELKWKATINVDRSQNVTFKELSFSCSKRMDFSGHAGTVYADFEWSGTVDPATLDLNPIPVNNTFRILPFNYPDLKLATFYHNRGFESAGNFTLGNATADFRLGLDYTKFPDSIDFVEVGGTAGGYYVDPATELEPLLPIHSVTLFSFSPSDAPMTMRPVPPNPIEDPLGDSNHDGKFDSGDLVQVFQAGEYEDSIVGNSTWEEGDWNLDKEFNTTDLVVAFTDGNYVNGSERVVEVPEPTGILPSILGLILFAWKTLCTREP